MIGKGNTKIPQVWWGKGTSPNPLTCWLNMHNDRSPNNKLEKGME
jgi:hypothetical protein